jgi:hypothetical protein
MSGQPRGRQARRGGGWREPSPWRQAQRAAALRSGSRTTATMSPYRATTVTERSRRTCKVGRRSGLRAGLLRAHGASGDGEAARGRGPVARARTGRMEIQPFLMAFFPPHLAGIHHAVDIRIGPDVIAGARHAGQEAGSVACDPVNNTPTPRLAVHCDHIPSRADARANLPSGARWPAQCDVAPTGNQAGMTSALLARVFSFPGLADPPAGKSAGGICSSLRPPPPWQCR